MLESDGVTLLRLEAPLDLPSPCAVFERLRTPGSPLDGGDVLPVLVVSGSVSTMQRVERAQSRLSRRAQDLQHVGHALVGFGHALQPIPDLAAFGNEVVVRIDDEQRGYRCVNGLHSRGVRARSA